MVFVVGHSKERFTHTGHRHTGMSVLTTCVYTLVRGACTPHVCTHRHMYAHHTCTDTGVHMLTHVCTHRYGGACTHQICVHTGEHVLTTHVHT